MNRILLRFGIDSEQTRGTVIFKFQNGRSMDHRLWSFDHNRAMGDSFHDRYQGYLLRTNIPPRRRTDKFVEITTRR